ncbi:UDP-galactose translocator isoform X1 [Octopus bimaculoides]|uniref:UDP-galactose translocator n=2 Tax=Octopus bimaculoides TaxID=37653 RepID=A0A0L8GMS7_OCTBM|nr:UDP-galactose translocator isoform X1 [Octopus bimaculoides]|eukprot:XP_014779820.1 PREDICTED: UDP-galactose translocator-like isoform X1 [Octopus bimaculoides]
MPSLNVPLENQSEMKIVNDVASDKEIKSVDSLATPKTTESPKTMKYISLISLTLQNALLALVMRYVRTRPGDLFMSTTAVIMSEILKFVTCLVFIFIQEGSVSNWLRHLNENIIKQPIDCMKVSIPSLVYTLQNNLLYVAVSNLDAATYQVTYQLKILTTAMFSVFMLNKKLSRMQWISLVILFMGVSFVQLQPTSSTKSAASTTQQPLKGLVAVIISCIMSGFAGVYFEKILKGTKPNLWLRNVQLGFLGTIIGLITMEIKDGFQVKEKGFFFGYDWVVWLAICLQSFGGLLVAVVVKYADNILKGFATSAAIIISCIVSIYFFDFQLTIQFVTGASLVICSVYMYSKYAIVTQ